MIYQRNICIYNFHLYLTIEKKVAMMFPKVTGYIKCGYKSDNSLL